MSTSQWWTSKSTNSNTPNTYYLMLPCSHAAASPAEASVQSPSRSAGSFGKLRIRVSTNDRTSTSTLSFRTGGVDGNQQVSIGSGLTGDFEDSSNTDSAAGAGELLNLKLIIGSGGTSFVYTIISIQFTPSTGQVVKLEALGAGTAINSGSTQYQSLCGLGSTQTTEANEQHKIRLTGTLRNLFVNVSTNNLVTASTTVRTRKNGANGSQSITIGAGLTGIFEDTGNTDSVVAGDLVNYQTITSGGGGGNLTYGNIGCELYNSSGSQYQAICATNNGVSISQGVTTYIAPSGAINSITAEDSAKGRVRVTGGFATSKLQVFIISNSLSASATVKLRKNNASANQTITIGSGLTGFFEDSSNTDSYAIDDYIAYQVAAGAGTGSIRFNNLGLLITPAGIIAPGGLASTLQIGGSGQLNPKISITGVASGAGIGSDVLTSLAHILPSGLASGIGIGTAKLNPIILMTGKSSDLVIGEPGILVAGTVSPSGRASTIQIGSDTLTSIAKIIANERASTVGIGSVDSLIARIQPTGLASGLVIGSDVLTSIAMIIASGRASTLQIGSLLIFEAGLVQFIVVPGVASGPRIGGLYVVPILECIVDWQELPVIGPSEFIKDVPIRIPESGVGGWG